MGTWGLPRLWVDMAVLRHAGSRAADTDTWMLGRRGLQGVVNRDIKLENTLLDSSPRPLVKICDFGYSKVLHGCTWQDVRCVQLLGALMASNDSCLGMVQLLFSCVGAVAGIEKHNPCTAAVSMCGHLLRTLHGSMVPTGRSHSALCWLSSCPQWPARRMLHSLPALLTCPAGPRPPQHETLHSAPISKVGTAYYTAPEVFLCENEYDGKVQITPKIPLLTNT